MFDAIFALNAVDVSASGAGSPALGLGADVQRLAHHRAIQVGRLAPLRAAEVAKVRRLPVDPLVSICGVE